MTPLHPDPIQASPFLMHTFNEYALYLLPLGNCLSLSSDTQSFVSGQLDLSQPINTLESCKRPRIPHDSWVISLILILSSILMLLSTLQLIQENSQNFKVSLQVKSSENNNLYYWFVCKILFPNTFWSKDVKYAKFPNFKRVHLTIYIL